MAEVNLPIDVIPGSSPPRFRWRQLVDTIGGSRYVDMEGALAVGAEKAVAILIDVTKRLMIECATLRGQVEAAKMDIPPPPSLPPAERSRRHRG